MIILMLILSLIGTAAAVGITVYAVYITSQVSGEKLLTLNSELGYKYATTYHNWQTAAMIAVAAVVLWILFIFILIRRHKKRRGITDS